MSQLLDLINRNSEEKAARGLSHTPAEILQQPDTWRTTFARFQAARKDLEEFLTAVGLKLEPTKRPIVFLIGAGTSDYIGNSLVLLLQQKWQCEVNAIASTDLLTNFDDYILEGRRYLWISFSRSGDSPEGVAVLEKALENHRNILHLIVSCNRDGRMIQASRGDKRVFGLLLDHAVNDRGLAMTSSFSNMVVCGHCLANIWTIHEYEDFLQALIASGEKLLSTAADVAASLTKGPYTSACFVGSGSLKAVARESALKVSELTAGQIPTMAESTLGLRHGPIAALDGETLFVCYVSSDPRRRRYEIDLLREIGNKGVVAARVAVGLEATKELLGESEFFVTPGTNLSIPDAYRPPLDVIFGQLLGLFFSIRCNLQPDRPSPTGVISRVVQSFEIH